MSTVTSSLSATEARKIIIQSQGLGSTQPFGNSIIAVSKAVSHLGYVQIDTISVVERAHHHCLWSRIPSYKTHWIEKTQNPKRLVFEYWSHAAAYLSLKDYRFSLPVMKAFRQQKDRWPKTSRGDMKRVLERIRAEGPLMSRDFESGHKGGSWWDWKHAKWALQRLFFEGELMVSHRTGFQRVYDLPERILPADIDTSFPRDEEYYSHLIQSTLNAQGLATAAEISHLRSVNLPGFRKVLNDMEEDGKIISVSVNGVTYFTLPDLLRAKKTRKESIHILSPFDNLVIWRKRLKNIFDFDFTLECYLPASKRQFGYFSLPVLHGENFTGRVDLKADRQHKILQVKEQHWLKHYAFYGSSDLYIDALKRFAVFNGCEKVKMRSGTWTC